MDTNLLLSSEAWERLVDLSEYGIVSYGTVILEGHIVSSPPCPYWVFEPEGKRLLGKAKLSDFVPSNLIVPISDEYLRAAGFDSFDSREALKEALPDYRTATVARITVLENEKYWCPQCFSVNLEFLSDSIYNDQLPFRCFDCQTKFTAPDKDSGSRRIKNTRLAARYCKEKIKLIPKDSAWLMAVVGKDWPVT